MKPLLWFMALLGVVFGGLVAYTTLTRETVRVFVVVDSSFAMTEHWDLTEAELDRLDDESFREFALATEKRSVHPWQPTLDLGATTPFGPCNDDFDRVKDYMEVAEADELLLITTEGGCDTSTLTNWEIISIDG